MIKEKITYGEKQVGKVEDYNISLIKDPNYWENDEVDPLRSEIKSHYLIQQDYRCCYCHRQNLTAHGRLWDVEHILPSSIYPEFLFEPLNLAVACVDCNSFKSDEDVIVRPRTKKYPKSSRKFRIIHPHYDNFEDHLVIINDRYYMPKKGDAGEKGEYTIYCCHLLRYSYKYHGRDPELADTEDLSNAFDAVMDAKKPAEQQQKLREVFRVVQL